MLVHLLPVDREARQGDCHFHIKAGSAVHSGYARDVLVRRDRGDIVDGPDSRFIDVLPRLAVSNSSVYEIQKNGGGCRLDILKLKSNNNNNMEGTPPLRGVPYPTL